MPALFVLLNCSHTLLDLPEDHVHVVVVGVQHAPKFSLAAQLDIHSLCQTQSHQIKLLLPDKAQCHILVSSGPFEHP